MRFNPITRFTPVVRSIPIFAMTLALAACDGAGIIITPINNSSSSSSASNHSEISESSSSVSSSSQSSDTEITKGISYPKPLTTREFYNSISLILGEDVPVALQDNELLGYHGSPSLPSIEEEAFLKVHQNIQTISESEWVATRIPNHQKGSVSDVADYVLSILAPLTYRRPLTDDEYKSMHAAILVSASVDEAIVKAINLLFTSTAFLYRLEIGIVAGGSLDSFEYATALAYIYSGAGPDKDLYDAARKGELYDADVREEHIERLIHSERGQAQVKHFAFIWLKAYGLLSAYQLHQDKNVNEDVYDAMMEEVSHLVKHVFYTPSAPFSDLLSADYTFLNSTLADYYGIPSNSDNPNDFVQTDTDERGGILTTGLFTIGDKAAAIPIGKALFVRRNLLCQTFPPEPSASEEIKQQIASVIDPLYEQGLLTPTKYYELAGDHLSCDSCHRYAISPLFALDDFDYQGLPRKRVAGKVVAKGLGPNGKEGLIVDAINNGRLYGIETLPTTGQEPFIPFYGSKDLGRKLAEQERVKQCFVQNLTNFAAGYYHARRITEASADIYKAFTEAGDDPMAAYKAIGHSRIIRLRQK